MSGIFSRKIGPHRRSNEPVSNFLRRIAIYYGFWAVAFFAIEIVVATALMMTFDEPNDPGLLFIMAFNVVWVILFFVSLISFFASMFFRYRESG
jgi:uncharacterized membrane protein